MERQTLHGRLGTGRRGRDRGRRAGDRQQARKRRRRGSGRRVPRRGARGRGATGLGRRGATRSGPRCFAGPATCSTSTGKRSRAWIVRETGAIPPKAQLETWFAASTCYESSGLPRTPYGQLLRTRDPVLSMARRVPVGVVGVISPFNFPLILSIRAVAPALALGNAVILKPDPRTSVSGGVVLARDLRGGRAARRDPQRAPRRRRGGRGAGHRPERADDLVHRLDARRPGRRRRARAST